MLLSTAPGSAFYYALLTLCLLLAGGASWQAWRAATGLRRGVRLLAGLAAVAALWLLAYPPTGPARPARAESAAILLTPGYAPDSVRALRRRLGPVPLLRYRPATAPGGDTLALSSLRGLPERQPALRQLHVLGAGLPAADVAALPARVQLRPHALATAARFSTAEWPRQLALGETLTLSGHLQAPGAEPVWVRLRGAGRISDSVRVPAGGGAFGLRYQPRYVGRQLLRLEARRGRALLAAEPVPVQVRPTRRLRVLLLAGSPSFELNLLKNHLAAAGHQVSLRLRLTPGLLQTDARNQPTADLSRLTPALLARYDALITDADALQALPAAEARALTAATTQGLGVLLIGATELPRALPGRSRFAVQVRPGGLNAPPQPLTWPDGRATTPLAAILRPTPDSRPLISGPKAGIVAAAARVGWGTVGVATPTSTYPWLLSGATATYAAYWRTLLGAAARPLEPAVRWSAPRWPRPDEPQPLQVAAARVPATLEVGPAGTAATTTLPLRQLSAPPEWWQATYWPARAGWLRVVAPRLDTSYVYVFGPTDWAGPLHAQRYQAAAQRPAPAAGAVAAAPVPAFDWPGAGWFAALFAVAAGWLWLDEKR